MAEAKLKARFTIKVQPRAESTAFDGKLGEAYKLRLAASPVDGKANEACVRFLARHLGVPASAVRIVHGLTGRLKVIEVDGLSPEDVTRRIES